MPLQPNFIERRLIRTGRIPGLMLDVQMATFQAWAVVAAAELGLFEELKQEALDLETLAARIDASERGLEVLVDVLVGLGYLETRNGRYRLSKAARRSLPVDHLRTMVPFMKTQMLSLADAARAVKEDPPGGLVGWESVQSGEVGRGYQATMRWFASGAVDEVAKKVDLSAGAERMLDVGGSHGLYTVAFCRKYPGLRGTVLDWSIGLEAARETLAENPDVAGRIDLVERDFEREELPDGYDFAFLGNIIHSIRPEGNRELFGKLARATTERGMVAVLDQFAGASGSKFARGVDALIGFTLFLAVGGRAYPYEEVSRWLSEAGFPQVSRKRLRQPGFSLVIAQKAP